MNASTKQAIHIVAISLIALLNLILGVFNLLSAAKLLTASAPITALLVLAIAIWCFHSAVTGFKMADVLCRFHFGKLLLRIVLSSVLRVLFAPLLVVRSFHSQWASYRSTQATVDAVRVPIWIAA